MVTFWEDLWLIGLIKFQLNNSLASAYARDDSISVNEAIAVEELDSMFNLSLSKQAFEELQELGELLVYQSFDEQAKDTWTYQWGNTTYSSSRFYKLAFHNLPAHPVFVWMWKSKCTSRVKFLAWLVLVDRLNTKSMLKRRHMFTEDDPHCVTCNDGLIRTLIIFLQLCLRQELLGEDWYSLEYGSQFILKIGTCMAAV